MADENKFHPEVYHLLVQTITASHHIEEMAEKLAHLLVGALGIKGASVFILNPDLEELELLASSGLSIDYVNKGPLLVGKSIQFGANREPVIIQDVTASDRLQYPEQAEQEGIRAIVSQPIVVRERLIGSLRLYHSERWEISRDDMRFVETLAQTIGLALLCFRLATAVAAVKETVNDIHPVWL